MNSEQLAAVESTAPWNLLIAGPGSGKTTTLVARAKWLADRGVDPISQAFVTFTNIGARVLRRRLNEEVGRVGFVGTLHAMMLRLLKQENQARVLIGETDSDEFMMRHAKLLAYKGSRESLLAERRTIATSPIKTPARRVIDAYWQFMRAEGLLDYDLVLVDGLRLVKANGIPWTALFVDEMQDSSEVDARIYLAANPAHLFVVGDSDQAIFSFRGGRPENITDYAADPRFTVRYLSTNYRCNSLICDVANDAVALNKDRAPKLTISATEHAGEIAAEALASDIEELHHVSRTVRDWIKAGIDPSGIAVLCRTNVLTASVRAQFALDCIRTSAVDSAKKPRDWRVLMLLLAQLDAPGSWANAKLLAREMARLKNDDPDDAEEDLQNYRKTMPVPAPFFSLPAASVVLAMNANLSRFGISTSTMELMAERIRLYRPESIAELIEALNDNLEAKPGAGVNVLTVHGAKGDEFDAVCVPGADLFHSAKSPDEERRLFFVAVTRAKRFLSVTCAGRRTIRVANLSTPITQERQPGEMWSVASAVSKRLLKAS